MVNPLLKRAHALAFDAALVLGTAVLRSNEYTATTSMNCCTRPGAPSGMSRSEAR